MQLSNKTICVHGGSLDIVPAVSRRATFELGSALMNWLFLASRVGASTYVCMVYTHGLPTRPLPASVELNIARLGSGLSKHTGRSVSCTLLVKHQALSLCDVVVFSRMLWSFLGSVQFMCIDRMVFMQIIDVAESLAVRQVSHTHTCNCACRKNMPGYNVQVHHT